MKRIMRSTAIVLPIALLVALSGVLLREMPAAAEGETPLSVDMTCTPGTFRPNEWVVAECVTRFTNESQDNLSGRQRTNRVAEE